MAKKEGGFTLKRGKRVFMIEEIRFYEDGMTRIIPGVCAVSEYTNEDAMKFYRSNGEYPTAKERDATIERIKKALVG